MSFIRRAAINSKKIVAVMIHTNQLEQEAETGTAYWGCSTGVDLRRTEIACVAYGIQALVGSPLRAYTTYFFVQAG
jgi:SP family general alpha glucoside:H+ symporter-like MFS transporter